jgi:hypothetical protein
MRLNVLSDHDTYGATVDGSRDALVLVIPEGQIGPDGENLDDPNASPYMEDLINAMSAGTVAGDVLSVEGMTSLFYAVKDDPKYINFTCRVKLNR